MSKEENKVTKNEEVKAKYALSKKISAEMEGGVADKLDSYFDKVVRFLERENTKLAKNIDIKKFKHKHNIEDLNDKLEDAEATYEAAYSKVPVNQISNNDSQKAYVQTYLDNIDTKRVLVEIIKDSIKEANDTNKQEIADLKETIAANKEAIDKISA